MAAFQGSALNSLLLADAINQFAEKHFISTIRKESALLNLATGDPSVEDKGLSFARTEQVTGKNVEVPYVITARTPVGVIDGAAELAARTPADVSGFGAVEAPIAHYMDVVDVRGSLLTRIGGDEEKLAGWLTDLMQQVTDSYLEKYAVDLNATSSTSGPTYGQLGSWCHAVSSGLVADGEGNYATWYGGLDRTDAANASLRGVVRPTIGTLTLAKIYELQTALRVNRSKASIAIAGPTVYAIAHALVEGKTQVIAANSKLVEFGSQAFNYAGIDFALEAQAPAQHLGLLDADTWFARMMKTALTEDGLVRNPGVQNAKVMFTEQYFGVYCKNPFKNGKMTGITG